MKLKIIDANYILRYLLCDNKEQNQIAKNVIENEDVLILNEVLAEVCYVLEKVYEVPKQEISQLITELIAFDNITTNQELINRVIEYYQGSNLDIVDALLIAYNQTENAKVYSFDKKLNKMLK